MADKKTQEMINDFSGFEALTDALMTPDGGGSSTKDPIPEVDPEELLKDLEDEEEEVDEDKPDETDDEIEEDDDQDKPDEDKPDEEDDKDDSTDDEGVSLSDDDEAAVTQFFQEKLADKLNWDFTDDEKFNSVDEMVDYMEEVVKASSKPNYASEDIEKLNEYVANGGDLKTFYDKTYSTDLDLDKLDLSEQEAQRAVVREGLKTLRNYKDDRINRIIQRYEDAGVLEDEAEDNVELLKDYQIKKQEKLLEEQKNTEEVAKQQQQNFLNNVKSAIDDMDDIMGVPISKQEKDDLLNYMFKPDKDGMTQYQKEYSSDIKHLLQSAFFTQKGAALITKAKKSGSSKTAKELHQRLKASKDKRSKGSVGQGNSNKSDPLNLLGGRLLKKV